MDFKNTQPGFCWRWGGNRSRGLNTRVSFGCRIMSHEGRAKGEKRPVIGSGWGERGGGESGGFRGVDYHWTVFLAGGLLFLGSCKVRSGLVNWKTHLWFKIEALTCIPTRAGRQNLIFFHTRSSFNWFIFSSREITNILQKVTIFCHPFHALWYRLGIFV